MHAKYIVTCATRKSRFKIIGKHRKRRVIRCDQFRVWDCVRVCGRVLDSPVCVCVFTSFCPEVTRCPRRAEFRASGRYYPRFTVIFIDVLLVSCNSVNYYKTNWIIKRYIVYDAFFITCVDARYGVCSFPALLLEFYPTCVCAREVCYNYFGIY